MDRARDSYRLGVYVSLALGIALGVYALPRYDVLKTCVAVHSAAVLTFFGVVAPVRRIAGRVLLGAFEIVRDCTGVQVMAVFSGLIIPFPYGSWPRKVGSLGVVGALLYATNLFRVVLEYWLVEQWTLPWSLVHYPLGLAVGIVSVFFFVLVSDRMLPAFGDAVYSAARWVARFLRSRPHPSATGDEETGPREHPDED
jgi:exosortase/archaeosortase family protein